MNGSPWVNWQEFASLNESETQRIADEAQKAQEARRAQMQAAFQQLSNEASEAGKQGGYRGVEGLGSYQQLMKMQQEDAARGQPGAMSGAPWEALMNQGQRQKASDPWADFSKYMGAAQQAGKTGQTYYDTMRRNQARELDEYQARQQGQRDRLAAQQKQYAEDARRSLAEREYDDQRRRYAGKL